MSYDELEPHYDFFEKVCGISGKAGNVRGVPQEGGNTFEGWRENEYPTPPLKMNLAQAMFQKATTELGLHPFPLPSADLSVACTNPYGMRLAPCTHGGFCEWFGCANSSDSSPQTCVSITSPRRPRHAALGRAAEAGHHALWPHRQRWWPGQLLFLPR